MPLATLLVGIAMLLFGRRLFWVFVAGAGFATGALLAVEWLHHRSDAIAIAIAVGAGVVAALIAVFAQRAAIGLGGLLAGGYLGHSLAVAVPLEVPLWIPVVVGAVLGAILLAVLFDWALIALSAFLGAAIIAQAAPLDRPWSSLAFVLLLGAGLGWQSKQRCRKPESPSPKPG